MIVLTDCWSDREVSYHGTVYLLLCGWAVCPVRRLLLSLLVPVSHLVSVWPLLRCEGRPGQHGGLGVSVVPG